MRGFGIEVIVIEPGPIRTEFTATAIASLPAASAGVYADYHAAVAKGDAETDESFIAGDAGDVASAIERALTARRPRARYRVKPIAWALPKLRALLGDRGFDAFLRTQIKPPRAKN